MKKHNCIFPLIISLLIACDSAESDSSQEVEKETKKHEEVIHLSAKKANALNFKMAAIPYRHLENVVTANGELEVPPQHEAEVTAVVGGNIESIKVIEGDKVKKGEVLAYLKHPNLIKIQTAYQHAYHEFQLAEKEYNRQKKLYEKELAAGRSLEKSKANYFQTKGKMKGLEAQIKQLNHSPTAIQEGKIFEITPVLSPIKGFIEKVLIKTAQYVQPQTSLFKIVNTDHIHADLKVFEKDAHKVKIGQIMYFQLESAPEKRLKAEIYSVGKRLEDDFRAVHLHAEIKDAQNATLLPGMYISGKIIVSNDSVLALPEEAVVDENGKSYIFEGSLSQSNSLSEWSFTPIEVKKGIQADHWVEIIPLSPIENKENIVHNNAYYLIAEQNKGENTHSH